MANRLLVERALDVGDLGRAVGSGDSFRFLPLGLEHIYIKLDFKPQFENACTADDGRGFLRSVARGAMGAHRLAAAYGGFLLEVQGSMLHVGLPIGQLGPGRGLRFAADLHRVFREVFNQPGMRVDGWRLTLDAGRTLVVRGHGVHGDDSWVCLGDAANRPAKYLYSQLELPEDRRALRRFWIGVWNAQTGRWMHESLAQLNGMVAGLAALGEEVRGASMDLDYRVGRQMVQADAAPLGPRGTPASPKVDRPNTYYGWVLRTDLDGFTSRVESCFGDEDALAQLATQFATIMDAAAGFTASGTSELLVQLPWAGDNFTVACVFPTNAAYQEAVPTRLVELSLDFEKYLEDATAAGGFRGWAHGIAGGRVHGNAGGNVYLGGIEVGNRRFLVGAGEGFGRSAQAFGDINPKCSEVVLYEPDWDRLAENYKDRFERGVTVRGEKSTLYRVATKAELLRARTRKAASVAQVVVTGAGGSRLPIPSRPYCP
jgi:hypothetical protein